MHYFAEIQTAHHGSGSNGKHEPQRRCPHLCKPTLRPTHALLEGHSQKCDCPSNQGGHAQDSTENLHRLAFHTSILAPKNFKRQPIR